MGCADGGGGAGVVATMVGVAVSTVRRWRERFLAEGLEGLRDRPRPGHPPQIGMVPRLEIVATACDRPTSNDGMAGWTLDRLRDEVLRRGIVPAISRSTLHRILERADLKPHRVQGWLHSPDPEFREKATEICELYLHPPDGAVVISIDEKTGMQAIERKHPDEPARPGRPVRREFEYVRHGTQSLIAGFDVREGKVLAQCGDTRTAEDLVCFMDHVAAEYPDREVHVVWDNLNIHGGERWKEFNRRHGGRFHFHYTPLHASWVNQVELFFGILQTKCLKHGSFASATELRDAVTTFIRYWNEHVHRPFRWTFTGYPLQSGIDLKEVA